MDRLSEAFGAVIRARREELGLTQDELAHEAKVTRNHVSLLERGHRSPTLSTMKRLADALGQTLVELLSAVPGAR